MKHTVIAVFDHDAQARQAADALARAGLPRTAVHVGELPPDEADPTMVPATVIEGGPGVTGRLMDFLSRLFGVESVPHGGHYAEAVRRGGTLVSVDADDEAQAARARDALLAAGAVNIDDRVEEWRREDGAQTAGDAAATPVPVETTPVQQPAGDPDGRRWIALHRQEVSIGGVRVYGHTVVHAYDDYADDFRADHATRYGAQGGAYDDYDPAYRYGHALGGDARYRDRDWDDIEADVRSDWERRHPGSAWERFKGAVRHAWERVTR